MVNACVNYLGKMLRRCKNERGMALLATMMAIALMTIIVVDFTSASALGYLSAANNANEIRATYLARSAINVGLALIAQDTRAQMVQAQTQQGASATTGQGQPFDSFASVWAIPFPPMPVNGGMIGLSVVDEARKFNINRLINAQPAIYTPGTVTPGGTPAGTNQPVGAVQPTGTSTPTAPSANGAIIVGQPNPIAINQFTSLLIMLGLDTAIVPAVLDWLDPDSVEMPQGGAESDYYMRLIPPYQPRNGPMPTIGDLRMVKGIDDATFAKLRNYVTVAPETAVNPNTASPEVLACLEPELTQNPDIVKGIIEARTVRPFATVTEMMTEVPAAAAITKLPGDLTPRGQYFSISGVGSYAGARKLVFATFFRNADGTGTLSSWQED
jgi:general secretion pathway protein K